MQQSCSKNFFSGRALSPTLVLKYSIAAFAGDGSTPTLPRLDVISAMGGATLRPALALRPIGSGLQIMWPRVAPAIRRLKPLRLPHHKTEPPRFKGAHPSNTTPPNLHNPNPLFPAPTPVRGSTSSSWSLAQSAPCVRPEYLGTWHQSNAILAMAGATFGDALACAPPEIGRVTTLPPAAEPNNRNRPARRGRPPPPGRNHSETHSRSNVANITPLSHPVSRPLSRGTLNYFNLTATD